MKKFVEVLKKKNFRYILPAILFGFAVILLLLNPKTFQPVVPPIVSNEVPPVVVAVPELTLLSVEPTAGKRESIDGYSSTVFKFSVPISASSLNVMVTPAILIKKTILTQKQDILIIEPEKTPWQDGVSYTLTIKAGAFGANGEVLKSDVVYTFSNTVPQFIELKNPI